MNILYRAGCFGLEVEGKAAIFLKHFCLFMFCASTRVRLSKGPAAECLLQVDPCPGRAENALAQVTERHWHGQLWWVCRGSDRRGHVPSATTRLGISNSHY
jgi:hypothetical protein